MAVDVKDRRRLFEDNLAVVRELVAGEDVDRVRTAPVSPLEQAAWQIDSYWEA